MTGGLAGEPPLLLPGYDMPSTRDKKRDTRPLGRQGDRKEEKLRPERPSSRQMPRAPRGGA